MVLFLRLIGFSCKEREKYTYFSIFTKKKWKLKLFHILQVYTQPLTSSKYSKKIRKSPYFSFYNGLYSQNLANKCKTVPNAVFLSHPSYDTTITLSRAKVWNIKSK